MYEDGEGESTKTNPKTEDGEGTKTEDGENESEIDVGGYVGFGWSVFFLFHF